MRLSERKNIRVSSAVVIPTLRATEDSSRQALFKESVLVRSHSPSWERANTALSGSVDRITAANALMPAPTQ